MLKVENINVYYGAIHAIKDVSLTVHKNEIIAFIGANGAGKTTLLKTISGLLKSQTGKITFNDLDIMNLQPHKIVELKLSQVPEGRQIFANLTVEENLEMGAFLLKSKDKVKENKKIMFEMFPRLLERRKQHAGTLSGGEQQMLAIARALMSEPELLLLDEPSMGLSPLLVKEVFEIIKKINQQGVTILLVEQNARMALSIANRGYVLETGEVVLTGTGEELLKDDDVRKAYLGR